MRCKLCDRLIERRDREPVSLAFKQAEPFQLFERGADLKIEAKAATPSFL
jgi:hypothetical protein